MRVAVISDVHANLAALEAVLEAIDLEAPDAIWCLGDIVGYGPEPSSCRELVERRASICLSGNHDLGALGLIDVEATFSPEAAIVAGWTAGRLTAEDRRFLLALEPSGRAPGAGLYHGSPRDPVWEYVVTPEAARAAFAIDPGPLILVGHSHVPLAIGLSSDLHGGLAAVGTSIELAPDRWLLNPGSVGQPRDGDPRAAWLLLELELRSATFRRVAYDIERTQRALAAAGLPESLAARLAEGA
jgi:predicted phosphodiesterase